MGPAAPRVVVLLLLPLLLPWWRARAAAGSDAVRPQWPVRDAARVQCSDRCSDGRRGRGNSVGGGLGCIVVIVVAGAGAAVCTGRGDRASRPQSVGRSRAPR